MLYNVVLISAIQRSESAYIYIHFLPLGFSLILWFTLGGRKLVIDNLGQDTYLHTKLPSVGLLSTLEMELVKQKLPVLKHAFNRTAEAIFADICMLDSRPSLCTLNKVNYSKKQNFRNS